MNSALILIDIQNDYFTGGRNPLEGSLEASLQAGKLLTHFRRRSLPLFHIQHIATSPGASFFLPGTDGARTHQNVYPQPDEIVIQKHYPNSFRQTGLLTSLHALGIQHLVVVGMMTHMCVDATVRAANDLGFEVWLAQDGCATKALTFGDNRVPAVQVHFSFLAALQGTYADVMTADQILAKLV
jgi:nicotinamidase-related amidase